MLWVKQYPTQATEALLSRMVMFTRWHYCCFGVLTDPLNTIQRSFGLSCCLYGARQEGPAASWNKPTQGKPAPGNDTVSMRGIRTWYCGAWHEPVRASFIVRTS